MAACYNGFVSDTTYNGGYIYILNNGWVKQTQAGLGTSGLDNWKYIHVTPDGSQIAACALGGSIYTYLFSTNRWTKQTQIGLPATANWTSITSDANGSKMYAAASTNKVYYFYPINN